MRCTSTFSGESCSLEYGHGPLHVSFGGKVVWGELEIEDFEDGFDVPVPSDDDLDGPVTNAVQYYVPFTYVRITRRPLSRAQRNCKKCRAAGIVYDPYTAESSPCPSCQPSSR